MKTIKYKPAFTMLELIFVIVILGIVASIGAQVIAKTYEAYINQRALYKASIKTELVAIQIANRLSYAIPGSITRRDNALRLLDISIPETPANPLPVLQWIGYDRDGFTTTDANSLPGWSGFVDLTSSVRPVVGSPNIILSTPGSAPALSDAIIRSLSAGAAGIATLNTSALYFQNSIIHDGAGAYTMVGVNNVYAINGFAPNQLTIAAPPLSPIQEQYKLAWTSYAIVPSVLQANGTFNLELRYNFQPWRGENFVNGPFNTSVLLRNVSVFRFTGSVNSVRFKLCVQEQTGVTAAAIPVMTSICKEKVVIR
jgi:prepilin-type N-terminal cleavage/methylation domain-containing protein